MNSHNIFALSIVNTILFCSLRATRHRFIPCLYTTFVFQFAWFTFFGIAGSDMNSGGILVSLVVYLPILYIMNTAVALPAYFITAHIKDRKNFSLKFLVQILLTAAAYLFAILKVLRIIP